MMPNSESVRERNQELADRINQEAKQNPNSPYAGKFVGIVDGPGACVVAETVAGNRSNVCGSAEAGSGPMSAASKPATTTSQNPRHYGLRCSVDVYTRCTTIVGVPNVPLGFDGIACFRFLSHDSNCGNFGDPDAFGLDTLPLPGK